MLFSSSSRAITPPFDAEMLRHHQQHAITHHCRCHRQGNAGIAAGRLYQRIAGLDLAPFLRPREHGQRRTIFHRTGWVIALELDENGIAGIPGEALEFHQRRVIWMRT